MPGRSQEVPDWVNNVYRQRDEDIRPRKDSSNNINSKLAGTKSQAISGVRSTYAITRRNKAYLGRASLARCWWCPFALYPLSATDDPKEREGTGTPSTRRIVDAPPPSPPLESLSFITQNSRPREKAVRSFRFLIWLTAGCCRWGPRAPHSLAAGDPKWTYSEHGAYFIRSYETSRTLHRQILTGKKH